MLLRAHPGEELERAEGISKEDTIRQNNDRAYGKVQIKE